MVIYEGPSLLDGAPIVAVVTGVTGTSSNPKTGDMAQLWILAQGAEPHAAAKAGLDSTVCGNCPHRPANLGSCYVVLHQAPLAVWRKWKAGGYKPVDAASVAKKLRRKAIRLGAYGDPAALPIEVIAAVTKDVPTITGYTHQWRTCDRALGAFVMASCDSKADRDAAKAAGWRTYRVLAAGETKEKGEVLCPASEERPEQLRLTCKECGYCDGTRKGKKGDACISVHGTRAKYFKNSLPMAG